MSDIRGSAKFKLVDKAREERLRGFGLAWKSDEGYIGRRMLWQEERGRPGEVYGCSEKGHAGVTEEDTQNKQMETGCDDPDGI